MGTGQACANTNAKTYAIVVVILSGTKDLLVITG